MERTDRPGVATFLAADEPLVVGATISLGESVARHVRAVRYGVGNEIRLIDGAGKHARATIVRLSRETVAAQIDDVQEVAPLPAVHVLVPVADRERMLWLAEKAAELGVTSWRPVIWKRSRSVVPRGEGPTFTRKLRARMCGALEQSGGAHLPLLFPEATPDRAIAAAPDGARVVLEPAGDPLLDVALSAPVSLAIGPEGGFEAGELAQLEGAQFVRASLGTGILRFETAAVAAIAVARSVLTSTSLSSLRRGAADGH
ncbi:MAG TPA: RsmE family RNA methyltransferase [Gemmatimonadaceae bacterium]|nr:RsmE family RNA methyltransferase [Gemmatimonadaceae bacterium]